MTTTTLLYIGRRKYRAYTIRQGEGNFLTSSPDIPEYSSSGKTADESMSNFLALLDPFVEVVLASMSRRELMTHYPERLQDFFPRLGHEPWSKARGRGK